MPVADPSAAGISLFVSEEFVAEESVAEESEAEEAVTRLTASPPSGTPAPPIHSRP
jgi:hypothetical protein